jgi:hypothetical protein
MLKAQAGMQNTDCLQSLSTNIIAKIRFFELSGGKNLCKNHEIWDERAAFSDDGPGNTKRV